MANLSTVRFQGNTTQAQKVHRAHIVKENPFQAVASSVSTHTDNLNNLRKALTKSEGSDYTLGRMNDTTIRMGSLGIATLASSLAFSKVSGINEFIGFACWFASMGLSPKIVNKMVQAKFGLDLDKEYVDTYGRRQKFFKDPGFICWDLMPNEELDRIGDKMGISKNIVNRREAIQEKIQQVVVQSQTWNMVSAGVATPVLASLMADGIGQLKPRILDFFHGNSMKNVEAGIEKALASGNVEKAKSLLAKVADKTFGMNEGSAVARLWTATPEQVVKKTGILEGAVSRVGDFFKNAKKVLTGKQAWIPKISTKAPAASESIKIRAISDHLVNNAGKAAEGAKALEGSVGQVKGWAGKLIGLMKAHPELHDDALEQFIKFRTSNIETGFNSMKIVLEEAAKKDPKSVSKLLKGLSDAGVRRELFVNSNPERVLEYLGKSDRNKAIVELIKKGKTGEALEALTKNSMTSKTPIKFVDDAVSNSLLHSRWLKRIGGIGLGLVVATALYSLLFIGNSNKYNPKIKN